MNTSIKNHWEHIYQTKQSDEVSWTQEVPEASLHFIHSLLIPKDARIIDIGGGDSKLVDYLLKEGYTNVTVLDIATSSIERAKKRLGTDASKVTWIVSDILDFKTTEPYDVWHDRAAFHFQTDPVNIRQYLDIIKNAVDGIAIIGTFSLDGPTKCSGLDVQQYDEDSMKELFQQNNFEKIECIREDHITPAGAVQNFVFCSFTKK